MSEQGITQEDERWIEERRLAALEQRVGALIDMEAGVTSGAIGWTEYRTRLAALRAPGVGANPTKDALREAVVDLMHAILGCDGHPCRIESDPLAYRDDALRRFRDIETSASQRHDAVAQVHGLESALATTRRERDEAAGVLRAMIQWQADMEREEEPVLFDSIIARARALVAGQAPSSLDAIMTEREADLIGESLATERGLRDQIATRDAEIERLQERCRAAAHALVGAVGSATPANVEELAQRAATEIETLRAKLAEAERCAQESADIMRRARDRAESYCLRLGEAESQRDAFRAHAIKLDALCVRAANLLRDWCGTEPRALAEDIRARGEVPR